MSDEMGHCPRHDEESVVSQIVRYVQQNPEDHNAMLALADAMYEVRGTFAECLRIANNVQTRARAAKLTKLYNELLHPYTVDWVERKLLAANSGRKTHVVTFDQIIDAVKLIRAGQDFKSIHFGQTALTGVGWRRYRTQFWIGLGLSGQLRIVIDKCRRVSGHNLIVTYPIPELFHGEQDYRRQVDALPVEVTPRSSGGVFTQRLLAAVNAARQNDASITDQE